MTDENNGEEKQLPATEKRLRNARLQGDVSKSVELAVASTYFLFAFLIGVFGSFLMLPAGALLMDFLRSPVNFIDAANHIDSFSIFRQIISILAYTIAFILVPFIAVIFAYAAQDSLVFVPTNLMPKLSRISPIANFKKRIDPSALFEFVKGIVKLLIVTVIVSYVLYKNVDLIVGLTGASIYSMLGVFFELIMFFVIATTCTSTAIAALDMLIQRYFHAKRIRMSLQELKQESKESDGDPYIKSQRRRRAIEIANNRMMADVPTADVIVVNPTHFAIALRWDRKSKGSPICVAKGSDEVAARIRNAAVTARVPIHHDAPTARSLYAVVEIGQNVPPDLYGPVAAAIRFSENVRKLVRARNGQ